MSRARAQGLEIDFWAFGLVLFHMVLLCLGTSESALFNRGAHTRSCV